MATYQSRLDPLGPPDGSESPKADICRYSPSLNRYKSDQCVIRVWFSQRLSASRAALSLQKPAGNVCVYPGETLSHASFKYLKHDADLKPPGAEVSRGRPLLRRRTRHARCLLAYDCAAFRSLFLVSSVPSNIDEIASEDF